MQKGYKETVIDGYRGFIFYQRPAALSYTIPYGLSWVDVSQTLLQIRMFEVYQDLSVL